MLRKLQLLVAALLLQTTVSHAQSASLVRTLSDSDSMTVAYVTMSPDEKWLVFTQYEPRIGNGCCPEGGVVSRLMIRPLSGGPLRELPIAIGFHDRARFTPAGDRLVFLSTLPKRNEADKKVYVVSAPFDTRTGELTGPPRQISIDGVNTWGGRVTPDVSPDGRWIVYVGSGTNAIKIVPVTGGIAKTLVEPQTFPESIAWSADGQFLSYVVADGPAGAAEQGLIATVKWMRMRVSRDGGAAVVVARSIDRLGPLAPDGLNSYAIPWNSLWRGSTLRWFAASGQLLGEFTLPPRSAPIHSAFVAGGRYIIGSGDNSVLERKIVPVDGGPIRRPTTGTDSECTDGWRVGGEFQVCTVDASQRTLRLTTSAGDMKGQTVRVSDDPSHRRTVGSWEGQVVYLAGDLSTPANWRLMALSLKDGSRKQLAQNVLGLPCCDPRGAGDMQYGMAGGEFYYRQARGNRVQLRAVRVGGESRLIGEIPAGAAANGAVVFQNRIVYLESDKDSARLQLVPGAGRPAKTLATTGAAAPYIRYALSHDGRQLAVGKGTHALFVYRLDAEGNFQGLADPITLPFDSWRAPTWLPDGSGLLMIAVSGAGSEVALVKMADPLNPVLLAKDDPVVKIGYSLSPDGKFVAYSSEPQKGSSIYLIDVAQMMKRFPVRK